MSILRNSKSFYSKALLMMLLVFVAFSWRTQQAHATLPVVVVGGQITISTDISPTGISKTIDSQMQKLKSFILDHLATIIAKQILHHLTLSVINWINSGFQGNPGFVTNPGGFLLDAADQVTGSFIAQDGPLSNLCSPFSVDIRLSLALQQTQMYNTRYTCTLGTIINNVKNTSLNVSVNGNNVATMQGFLGGDFSQGGWPAFIALTTENQNNPYGSYLQSESDLLTSIGKRKSALSFDVQLGNGFMSWDNCSDITNSFENNAGSGLSTAQMNELYKNGDRAVKTGQDQFGNDYSIQKTIGSDGKTVNYQSCQASTPGSAIASKLFTNLNAPEVELELANDINAVVNALVTQLVSQMLSKGLNALSGGSSGGPSYTSQALQSVIQQTQTEYNSSQNQINSSLNSSTNSQGSSYTQAINDVSNSRDALVNAEDCFKSKLNDNISQTSRTFAQTQISQIEYLLTNTVNPLIANLTVKKNNISGSQVQLSSNNTDSQSIADLQSLQTAVPSYQTAVQNNISAANSNSINNNNSDGTTNNSDITSAENQAAAWNSQAVQYTNSCNSLQ